MFDTEEFRFRADTDCLRCGRRNRNSANLPQRDMNDNIISYFQIHYMCMWIFCSIKKLGSSFRRRSNTTSRLHNFSAERANCWMGSRRRRGHLEEGLSLLNNNASSVTTLSKVIVVKAKREPSDSIMHRMIHDTVAQNRLIIVEINLTMKYKG